MKEFVSELKWIKACTDNKGKIGNFADSMKQIKRKTSNSNVSKSGGRRSSNSSANDQSGARNRAAIDSMETTIIKNSFPSVYSLLSNMKSRENKIDNKLKSMKH